MNVSAEIVFFGIDAGIDRIDSVISVPSVEVDSLQKMFFIPGTFDENTFSTFAGGTQNLPAYVLKHGIGNARRASDPCISSFLIYSIGIPKICAYIRLTA